MAQRNRMRNDSLHLRGIFAAGAALLALALVGCATPPRPNGKPRFRIC
jgi:hypothetical protein